MENEKEQELSADWLKARKTYDDGARDPVLCQRFIELISLHENPRIADLGGGTGNNISFLLPLVPANVHFVLIEKNTVMLNAELMSTCQSRVTHVKADLFDWIEQNQPVDMLCANALLDLLTRNELESLIDHIAQHSLLFYSTLNYTGLCFEPAAPDDRVWIDIFERHMSRPLDRGTPLGASVGSELKRLERTHTEQQIHTATSCWVIENNNAFLQANLDFYETAVLATIDAEQKPGFYAWLNNKRKLAVANQLVLKVQHNDYLIGVAS